MLLIFLFPFDFIIINNHPLRVFLVTPLHFDALSKHLHLLGFRVVADSKGFNLDRPFLTSRRIFFDDFNWGINFFGNNSDHGGFNHLLDNWSDDSIVVCWEFLVRHGLMGEISVPGKGSQILRADGGTRKQPGADHSAGTAVIENCKDVKK